MIGPDRYSKHIALSAKGDDWFKSRDNARQSNAEDGSERLRLAIVRTGQQLPPELPRRRLSFDEQLARVTSGRASIIDMDQRA